MKTTPYIVVALTGLGAFTCAYAKDPVVIAYVVALSGPFANVGETQIKHAQFVVDKINNHGGVLGGRKLELLPMDHKNSPQEALVLLSKIVDRGIRFISYCCASHVAVPLAEAVQRHNTRNPHQRIVLLVEAGDQELTNDKCNFWSFSFLATAEILADALTSYVARQPNIKRVYLINQDYVWGHQNQRFIRDMLTRKQPNIRIVGDDLHPLGKVKDFAPYVAKIRAAKPDVVMTANWGNDMVLLVKAAAEARLDLEIYTYYAVLYGAPTAMGKAATDKVKAIYRWHPNVESEKERVAMHDYQRRYNLQYYALPSSNVFNMLAKAIDSAASTDPLGVAYALENIQIRGGMGEVWMRPEDHQLFEPLYIMTFTAVNGRDVKYGIEGPRIGTRTEARIEAADTMLATRCKMARPTRP